MRTTRGCPITQLYLESGEIPARFEIQKMRCLYLKNILSQDENNLLYKFFMLQLEGKSRGDWATTILADLKELNIKETFEEIKLMSKRQFTNILKSRIRENALNYLVGKQKSKGKEIMYNEIQMAEYLLPDNNLTVIQKQKMFAVRNRMLEMLENFPGKDLNEYCICGQKETIIHIYNCEILSDGEQYNYEYETIFNGKIDDQIEVFKIVEKNLDKREILNEKTTENPM